MEKLAVTSMEIDPLIARRWSPRVFDPGKKVSREQVIRLCEAARWAPSCGGDEPWRFIVWDKERDEASYSEGFECLDKWNKKWVVNCPVLMCAIADTKFREKRDPNRWGGFDTGAASLSIYLQAFSMGIAAHPMGGFDKDMIREKFAIPEDFIPMAMIAVGHMKEDLADADPYYKEKDLAPRARKPLGDNFFDGKWLNPIA